MRRWDSSTTSPSICSSRPARTPSNTRAQNVNTIDEVPDSSWFTNRIGARRRRRDLVRGPNVGPPPAPDKWVIIREKSRRRASGFTARDANGETWFLSFDPPSNPEGGDRRRGHRQPSCSGRSATTRSRPFSPRFDPARLEIDPQGDDPAALGREHAVHAGRPRRRPRARGAERRRHLSHRRRPGCSLGRSSARSATTGLARTIPTTSCRTSIDASCARCVCSAPGPTSPT